MNNNPVETDSPPSFAQKWKGSWMLTVLALIYLFGELGHYLIGAISRNVAQDLHYGSMGCMEKANVPFGICSDAETATQCTNITTSHGTHACDWDYTGLGMAYQIIAGPSFMAVFTVAGIFWGIAADKTNRVYLLFAATLLFSIATACTGLCTTFWQLLVCRMLQAVGVAGCSPLAAGMICDVYNQKQRATAMSLYNCGMYIGYGMSYAVGAYVTEANLFNEGWRSTFMISGLPGIVIAILLIFTVKDPQPKPTEQTVEDKEAKEASYSAYEAVSSYSANPDGGGREEVESLISNHQRSGDAGVGAGNRGEWKQCFRFVILYLILAACLRRSAGYVLRYNSALFFQVYYPGYDAGWWLTMCYTVGGILGSLLGGVSSDKLVKRLGVSARAVVLAVGQIIATPFSIAMFYIDPPWVFIPQAIGYLFGAMWFGAMFTILVEVTPPKIRSTAFGVAFFIMENFGGNFPVIVHNLSELLDYRLALLIMYPGELILSAVFFFLTYLLLRRRDDYTGQ